MSDLFGNHIVGFPMRRLIRVVYMDYKDTLLARTMNVHGIKFVASEN